MRRSVSALTSAVVSMILIVAQAIAQSSQQSPKEAEVDFWQPLWMQRELWEPGTMPPGMRARLLRHYTFMHYGIQKDYQGATSNVGSSKDVIEEGARIYSQGVCGMSR